MPIYLDIQPRLDDRAARQVSDQAKKYYADAAGSAAEQFNKAITAGLANSDAAVRKSAENTEKAYKKAADAAGLVRVEEAKLDDLRSKGSGGTAMLTQSERLDKARRAEISTARTAITAFQDLDVAQRTTAGSGSLLAGVLQGIVQEASGTRIGGIASAIEGIGTKGIVAAAGVGAIAVGIGAATKAVYDLGAQWDSISDSITIRTGKLGADLKSLKDVVGDVGGITAAPLGSISDIVGQLSQSMPDLAANNTAVRQMASNLAYLDANGQAVDIRALGEAFNVFGVKVADQVSALDALAGTSRATGIPLNQLIQTVQSGAPQFKQFGLNMAESTGLLASFEHAGLDANTAVTGLKLALKNIGGEDANKKLADVITQIKALHDAGNEPGARGLAADFFGTENFGPFLEAIESSKVSVAGLKKLINDLGPSLQQMQAETDDGAQGLTKLWNTIQTKLGPAADFVFGAINTNIKAATGNFTDLQTATSKMADHLRDLAAIPIAPDSALGRILVPGVLQSGTAVPGAPAGPGLPTTRPGAPTTGLGPNFYRDWYKTPEELKRDQGSAKLPAVPAVAYDTSLPSGFAGVPQTSEIVGAENSWMDARHTLAEKQARLEQLQKDNNAKADDITKARNDIIQAQQGQQQAELRLYDARQSLYDKENKALNAHTTALGEFGAKLDQDLGISKGLSGIADNLVRFLGNLALAPEMAKLNAISEASPSKGGFGLMGILGAQGAFGPRFTGIDYSKQGYGYGPSAMGPAGLQPGSGGGQPYGLPRGSNSGGYGGGGVQFPDWVNQLGAAFGVKPSTYPGHQESNRNEAGFAPNPQDLNRAIDWSGPVANMERFSEYLSSIPGSLEQLIFQNPQTGQRFGVAGGQDVSQSGYYAGDYGGHQDHVHTRQSVSIPLPSGGGGSGGGGLSPEQWNNIAGAEASGNWGINSGNGYSGGLQFDPNTWNQYGGQQYAPQAWQASPQQQMAVGDQVLAGQGPGAWPATSAANPGWFQPQAPGTWGGPGLPAGITGGGEGPVFGASPQGPGLGASATAGILGGPGVGSAAGAPTQIGAAVAPPSGTGKGGIGITPGGSIDTALGVAASMFPGLGQAAQTGVKLASRAIQFGGQVAGIATQGAMETFLPTGGSQLASNSWFSKIVGGLAGAAPALPNMAGKPAAPPAQGQGGVASGQGQGPPPGPPQITVNNNRATEDGTGRDVAYHMQNMYQPAGQP